MNGKVRAFKDSSDRIIARRQLTKVGSLLAEIKDCLKFVVIPDSLREAIELEGMEFNINKSIEIVENLRLAMAPKEES